MKYILFFSLAVLGFTCDNKPTKKLNAKLYTLLVDNCSFHEPSDLVVYYFDGDCALCISKAQYLDEKIAKNSNDVKLILIAKTMNSDALMFKLNDLKVKSCVFVEKHREFERDLDFLKITKIDKDRSEINYDRQMLEK